MQKGRQRLCIHAGAAHLTDSTVRGPQPHDTMLYLVGLGVLLLLGLISDSQTSRAWTPDASAILYEKYWKLHGGVDAISNRADGVGNSLLALGAQYGWQLACNR